MNVLNIEVLKRKTQESIIIKQIYFLIAFYFALSRNFQKKMAQARACSDTRSRHN